MSTAGADIQRWWRQSNSKWVLAAICGLGLATWAGFLYIGIRARRTAWKVAAGLYGAGAAAILLLFALTPRETVDGRTVIAQDTWHSPVAGALVMALWGGGIVHALIANRRWLDWLAANTPSPTNPLGPFAPYATTSGPFTATYSPLPSGQLVPPPFAIGPVGRPAPPAVGLEEPWAGFVRNAESLGGRFRGAAAQVAAGPLQSTLQGLVARVDRSVAQSRQVAAHGQTLTTARRGIDVAAVDAGLAATRAARPGPGDERNQQIIEALQAQRAAADRIDRHIDDTLGRLRLIDARLGEALARVLELSAQGSGPPELLPSSSTYDIEVIVAELESLRLALDDVEAAELSAPW